MKIYKQVVIIFLLSLLGQSIVAVFNLSVPASIIGMIILFLFLQFKVLKVEKIELVSDFLVQNLRMLFIPAGVGIMTKFHLIKEIWVSFLIVAIFSTVISLIISVKTVEIIKKKFEEGK